MNRERKMNRMSDDTISRQTAIAYAISGKTREFDGDKWIRVSEVRESLKTMPSVQSERKTGHWIEIISNNHTYKCSVCGRHLVNIMDGKNNVAKNYPYCHCGADMRGDQNE